MTRTRRTRAAAGATIAALALAACNPLGDPTSSPTTTELGGPEQQLTVLSQGPVLAWDPQRITSRQQALFAGRTYMRTLTTYAAATDLGGQKKLVGDLATGLGRPSKDRTSWTFTLRRGISWQDGTPVTCSDVRHGVARSFAKETGAAGYALTYLDIPKNPDGTSKYPGPYGTKGQSAAAKKLIEHAVGCKGRTVTFRLSEPVADFSAVASLPELAPVKAPKDERDASIYLAWSNGPYKLEQAWRPGEGGTWVRNEEWDPDSDPVRTPTLRKISHREGVGAVEAVRLITEGKDGSRAVLLDPLPQGLLGPVSESSDQALTVASEGQIVDYLAPNHTSKVLRDADVRTALALATDREAYAHALGGEGMATPTWSLLGAALPSAHSPVLDRGPTGDVEEAKALLAKAKQPTPTIRVAYRAGAPTDQAMAALEAGWEKAGFVVELKPIDEDYFTTISAPEAKGDYDVFWANWGADYPSASTVLPFLFDSRSNLSASSAGRDYGYVKDDKLNKAMDAALRTGSDEKRAQAWVEVDTTLLERASYIPLAHHRSTFVAGTDVTGLSANAVFGGAVELGTIGVTR